MSWQDVWNEVWKSLVVIIAGMLLLRLAGRKSISQMTIPTTVIMVSIGTVIVQPIADRSIWMALIAASTFVVLLLIIEAVQLKWNGFEQFMRSRALVVIQNGQLQTQTLKRLRLTVDQLEMKLRQAGIQKIEDVKTATIESNGQLGYELTEEAKPVTLKQLRNMLELYLNPSSMESSASSSIGGKNEDQSKTLFNELTNREKQDTEEKWLQ
ncbi:DUF421 domain-containing protein [Paenibacillus sp. CAA11]|uniref:DUF421 domain-containing protein n=1 Tax=Paenibacillus sp. CAA11 TaxID=1532905 RepID=UPI001F468F6C|nr:DUF421 domain-containing protein [Paenibacillus sp. CAA11]